MRPAGSDTEIQFNSGSELAATSSFRFIYASQSLEQGEDVIASGLYSHAEGFQTKTGTQNAYYAQSVASGVVILSGSYGDIASYFGADDRLYLYDAPFDGIYGRLTFLISRSYFDSTNTVVELYDTSVTTTTAYVGNTNINTLNWAGDQTIPGNNSHAEGNTTQAIGLSSHTEGLSTQAIGDYSHAEGNTTQAIGGASHAEGYLSRAIGEESHAEGGFSYNDALYINTAIGKGSHAEGGGTQAIGLGSHAEGDTTQAIGLASHAEGTQTQAIGQYSHAEGNQTIALGDYQHVQGQFNQTSSVQSAFIVGNGIDNDNRSNLIFAAENSVQITGSLLINTGSLNINVVQKLIDLEADIIAFAVAL